MTWEEAFAYVETVIEAECATQGLTVAITDPVVLAESIRLLRIGRLNYEASRKSP